MKKEISIEGLFKGFFLAPFFEEGLSLGYLKRSEGTPPPKYFGERCVSSPNAFTSNILFPNKLSLFNSND